MVVEMISVCTARLWKEGHVNTSVDTSLYPSSYSVNLRSKRPNIQIGFVWINITRFQFCHILSFVQLCKFPMYGRQPYLVPNIVASCSYALPLTARCLLPLPEFECRRGNAKTCQWFVVRQFLQDSRVSPTAKYCLVTI